MLHGQYAHLKDGKPGGEADEQGRAQSGHIPDSPRLSPISPPATTAAMNRATKSGQVTTSGIGFMSAAGFIADNGYRDALAPANAMPRTARGTTCPHGCMWHTVCVREG